MFLIHFFSINYLKQLARTHKKCQLPRIILLTNTNIEEA